MTDKPEVELTDAEQSRRVAVFLDALSEMPLDFQLDIRHFLNKLISQFMTKVSETSIARKYAYSVLAELIWNGWIDKWMVANA